MVAAGKEQAVAGRRLLWAILLLALALRLVYWIGARPLPGPGDASEYDHIARDWLASGRYLTESHGVPGARYAIRTPGYPALLAACYWAAGELGLNRFALLRPLQLLMDLASVVLLYLLGRRLFGWRVALAAGGLFAIYPPLWNCQAVAMTETVSVLLMLAVAWLLVLGVEQGRARWFAGAGAAAGMATLVRPLTQLVGGPVLVVAGLAVGWRQARGWLWGVAFALALGATVSPWLVRNYRVFGHPAPLATFGGMNFFTGNYLPYHGYFRASTYRLVEEMMAGREMDEVEVDAMLQRAAWRNIAHYLRHEPTAYAGLVWQKFRVFWDYYYHPWGGRYLPGGWGEWLHRALLLLAIPGAILAARRWRQTWPVLLIPVYLCLFQVATIAEEGRYNIIAMPYIMLLAALGGLYLAGQEACSPSAPAGGRG